MPMGKVEARTEKVNTERKADVVNPLCGSFTRMTRSKRRRKGIEVEFKELDVGGRVRCSTWNATGVEAVKGRDAVEGRHGSESSSEATTDDEDYKQDPKYRLSEDEDMNLSGDFNEECGKGGCERKNDAGDASVRRMLQGRTVGRGSGEVVRPRVKSLVGLKKFSKLTKKIKGNHREFIERTVFKPLLTYPGIEMDSCLAYSLVEAWVPQLRAFRLGKTMVKFTKFDVALLTGLPVTGHEVNLKLEEAFTDIGRVIKKKVGVGCNSRIAAMKMCRESLKKADSIQFARFFLFHSFSSVLFPREAGKAAWMMEKYAADLDNIGGYAWGEAVWRFIVEGLDDLKERVLCLKSGTCIEGFATLLQCWFLEHNRLVSNRAPKLFPRIRRWEEKRIPEGTDWEGLLRSFPSDQVVHVLEPMVHEMEEDIVRAFVDTDEWKLIAKQRQVRRLQINLNNRVGKTPREIELAICRAWEKVRKIEDKLNDVNEKLSIKESRKAELELLISRLEEENRILQDIVGTGSKLKSAPNSCSNRVTEPVGGRRTTDIFSMFVDAVLGTTSQSEETP